MDGSGVVGLNYGAAIATLREAWPSVFPGQEPKPRELMFVGAVGALETSFGQGWVAPNEACKGSNNWGAVQAVGSEPACQGSDSMPDKKRYAIGFKTYASPTEGAADLIRQVMVHRKGVAAVIAVLLTFWSRSSAWIAAVIGRHVDHARALASAGRTAAIASRG